MKRRGLLATLQAGVLATGSDFRRAHPERFVGATDDILFVENVAQILGVNVDFVRRIPRSELPAAKVGKRLTYLRDDVSRYVRRRRTALDPHRAGASHHRNVVDAATFDPVAYVRSDRKGDGKA